MHGIEADGGAMGCNGEKGPRTDRRAVRTHRAIQNAYRTLVIRDGLDKVTITALANEADIDRKTFYLHYASLDEVAEERKSAMIERIVNTLVEGKGRDGIDVNLRAVATELADILQEDPEFFRCVLGKISVDSLVEALYDPVRNAIIENSPRAAAADLLGADYLIRFMLSGTIAVALQWFLADPDTPIDEIADHIQAITNRIHLT